MRSLLYIPLGLSVAMSACGQAEPDISSMKARGQRSSTGATSKGHLAGRRTPSPRWEVATSQITPLIFLAGIIVLRFLRSEALGSWAAWKRG